MDKYIINRIYIFLDHAKKGFTYKQGTLWLAITETTNMRKTTQIVFIFVLCSLFSSCIPALENSLTAKPHFRQAWWGNTKDVIKFKERDKTIHTSASGSLVYEIQYKGVPLLLVYCFSKELGTFRLRAAGYMTLEPQVINEPNNVFRQELLNTLGEPTKTVADGGMVWLGEESVVYTNAYPDGNGSDTQKWQLITGYIDRTFYEQIKDNQEKERL